MNDRFVDASSSAIVRDAHKMILEFVEDYFDEEKQALVKNALKNGSIYFEKTEHFRRENWRPDDGIKRGKKVAGYCTKDDGVIILPEELSNRKFNPDYTEDIETDDALCTIIHEYAHMLRRLHSEVGEMFEEGFANIFAMACIKNYKLKHQPIFAQRGIEPSVFNACSYDYMKAESQIVSILYILNQKGLDIQLIGEYIFGEQNVFKQKCIEIFGEEFESYFELASSKKDQYYNDYEDTEHNSEVKLVSLLVNYMKNNGLNLSNYREPSYIMLFRRNSDSLERAVVAAGIESVREDERHIFESFKLRVDRANKLEQEDLDERKGKVRNTVSRKYDLKGKSKNEILKIVLDICNEYMWRSSSKVIENCVFIEEIRKLIPNIEEFVNSSIELNNFTDSAETVFKNLDMENVSYEGVSDCIFSTLEQFKQEELAKRVITKFNDCDNKDDLLTRIEELKEHGENIDLEQLLPNYSDFIKFVDELKDQIPDTFNQETNWNYDSLYEAFLKQYIFKKEKDLANSKELEKTYRKALRKINIQYKVLENEREFNTIKNNNDKLCADLLEKQQALEEEKKDRTNNEAKRDELIKRKEEIQKKNIIMRLFKRKEIRGLVNKITELENAMDNNDVSLEQIEGVISVLQGEIQDNEQQLIDLCGLSISDYVSILEECKTDNLTQDKLTEDAIGLQNKINALDIPKQEQEMANIYEKNGIERKNESVQTQIEKKKDDEGRDFE